MRPLSGGGQHCTSFRLVTDPPGVRVRAYRDRLGNHVQHLEVLEDHDRISITALSEVSTAAVFSDSARDPSPLQRLRLPRADGVRAVLGCRCVELSATAEGEGTETERAVEVMRTSAKPARLRDRSDRRDDAGRRRARARPRRLPGLRARDARRLPPRRNPVALRERLPLRPARSRARSRSHAWVDVLDAERGWVSLDPTHDREQTEAYVRVAVGRDYADVPPTRGVWQGNGRGDARRRGADRRHCERAARQRARRLARRGVRPLARRRAAAGLPAGGRRACRGPADGRPARRGSGHGSARAPAAGAGSRRRDALGGDPRAQPGRPARRNEAERGRRRPQPQLPGVDLGAGRDLHLPAGDRSRDPGPREPDEPLVAGSARRLRAGDPGADRADRAPRPAARRRSPQPARAHLRAR